MHLNDAPETQQVKNGIWTPEQAARFALADELKEHHEEAVEMLTGINGPFSDLLSAALRELSRVNWDEIAEHYIEDVS